MSLTTRILTALAILLAISACASDRSEDYARAFRLRGREYQVRFVEVSDRKTWPHTAWPMDLVMR